MLSTDSNASKAASLRVLFGAALGTASLLAWLFLALSVPLGRSMLSLMLSVTDVLEPLGDSAQLARYRSDRRRCLIPAALLLTALEICCGDCPGLRSMLVSLTWSRLVLILEYKLLARATSVSGEPGMLSSRGFSRLLRSEGAAGEALMLLPFALPAICCSLAANEARLCSDAALWAMGTAAEGLRRWIDGAGAA